MLSKPTPEALIALEGMFRQPRWSDVDKMLEAEIAEATVRLLSANELRLIGECQGRIKALREFQSTAREASATMERLGLRSKL